MCSLKQRSTCIECFTDLLKYLMLPTHSLDIIVDINIPRSVREGNCRQRSTNSGPKDNAWKRFLSNVDNKNILIALFVKFLESPETEEYRKYIV